MATKPQEYRWIVIDQMIREGNYPNNRTIAERLEVSRKTIQRDIDFLRYMKNVPIAYDKSKKGYYYADRSYRLSAVNIKEGDFFAIYISLKIIEQYKNTPLYEGLTRVYKQLQESITDRVNINPDWIDDNITIVPPAASMVNPDIWGKIANALHEKKTLILEYNLIYKKKLTKCTLDPYQLIGYNGDWYLIGYNHELKSFRTYALSRIKTLRVLNKAFNRREFNLSKHFNQNFGIFNSSEKFEVKMIFDSDIAELVKSKKWHPSQKIKQLPDGGIELSLLVNNLVEIKNWILSWGSSVKVIEPDFFAREIVEELRKALRKYH